MCTTPRVAVFVLLSSVFLEGVRAATTTLIHFGSPWRYHDFGTNPGTNWFVQSYGDGGWSFNFAQFGYGEGDELTETTPATATYFRAYVSVPDPNAFSAYMLRVLRDDGVIVYVNGTEVMRNNLPAGPLTHTTLAVTPLHPPAEGTQAVTNVPPSVFVPGANLIAVAIHQATVGDSDMSFNLQLTATDSTNPPPPASILRGPYLQVVTSSNIIVRWRTSTETETCVRYGTSVASLNKAVTNAEPVIDHEITLTGLLPDTKYFYAVGTSTQSLSGDVGTFFVTAPAPGSSKPTRIWAIGDFGTGLAAQRNVRNAYTNFTATRHTDAWLFLGDNAYNTGTDAEYQSFVFNVYSNELRRMVVWPALGNHETAFSQTLSDDYDYFRIFTMPMAGEAGGVASGSEHFYSYDYGNIHFIVLDSMTAIYRTTNGPMAQWLEADLRETTKDWIIAYFHHPPYTKGSHNSDTESDLIQMRTRIIPILEAGGVDLVLSGHSHCYERSFFLNGHYGLSSTIRSNHFVNAGNGRTNGNGAYLKHAGGMGAGGGTIYIVDGSSGGQGGGGSLNHPAMYYSTLTYGSLIIDIDGLRLDGTFLSANGTVDDTFTIVKGDYPGAARPAISVARAGTNAVLSWPTSHPEYHLQAATRVPAMAWTPVPTVATNGRRKVANVPARWTNEFFRLRRAP